MDIGNSTHKPKPTQVCRRETRSMREVTVKKWRLLAAVTAVCFLIIIGLRHLRASSLQDDVRHDAMKIMPPYGNVLKFDPNSDIALEPPSVQWETARRRFENTARNLKDFLDAELQRLKIQAVPGQEQAIDLLMEDIEGYQITLQRELAALRDVDKDETWRTAESRRLSDLVQRRIEYLQNPEDCNRAKRLVCDVEADADFGAKLHHVVYCLIFAYNTERTLVLDLSRFGKGWRAFFEPLSKTCVVAEGPRIEYNGNNRFVANTEVSRIIHLPAITELRQRHNFLPLAIPEDLAPRLIGFHGNPPAWWLGQFVRYAVRPNAETQHMLREVAKVVGFRKPIVGLHVVRTARQIENGEVRLLSEYMGHVQDFFRVKGITGSERRVYLVSDDPHLLEEARVGYPGYTFLSGSVETLNKEQTWRRAITDTVFLAQTDYLVCTFSSHIGRAAYELMQTFHTDASQYYRSLDDAFHYEPQNTHNVTAIEKHEARNENELSLEVGDSVQLLDNYWKNRFDTWDEGNFEGLAKGLNLRTGKLGMFPSYKVEDQIVAVKMPTYSPVKEREKVENDKGVFSVLSRSH